MDAFQLESWHWWALGLVSVVVEAMWPTGLFAGIALAGLAVGLLITLYPDIAWTVQLAVFSTTTGILYVAIQKYFYQKHSNDEESIEDRSRHLMGQEFELQMDIQNNFCELEIDGTHWEIKGRDQKAGTRVRVIGLDGNMLVVVPARAAAEQPSLK